MKPTFRGVIHQWAAPMAFGAGIVLVTMAPTTRSAMAAGAFALSLLTLFSVSATYHRVNWSTVARARMRRMDHASIFILIAGSYTPVALLGLPEESGHSMLLAVWVAAILGVVKSIFWAHAPKVLTAVLALACGWAMIPYLGDVRRALTVAQIVLIAIGGIAYTLGAVAYATKRPDLKPGVFGYHEVFHALTVVGGATHFAAIESLVMQAH